MLNATELIRNYSTAIYCRLSRDDGDGESMSISTQKQMLRQYAKEHGWHVEYEYADDGYSGMNFNRPDFLRMKADIEAGRIDILLTKDLSRLGRDYLETGRLTELYFPEYSVRYIAVNDGVDTARSDNEIIPFKNILFVYCGRLKI
jgi:DNA invertase Pin-like site-specific DNA recombinase